MKKVLLFLILFIPFNVFALDINIESKSAIVVNRENDEVLFEKNIEEKLPIASLTKIMTTIVALENIVDLDETVIIEENDINVTSDYVTLGLEVGMKITYKDLLYSTMIKSAADSAISLANHVLGYDEFINKMNELAKKLGMNNTHFSNTVGFDENNYSTASDLYKLLDYALENKNFYNIYTTQKYEIKSLDKTINNYVNSAIKNSDEIENNNIEFIGTKTGFTTISGASLSGIVNFDNNELLVITIGAIGEQDLMLHLKDSVCLLNEFKTYYSNRVLVDKNKLVDNIIYKNNKKSINYEIRTNKTITHYMDNRLDLNYLKVYYDGIKEIDKNISNNELLGTIKIYYNDTLLDEEKVLFNKMYIIKDNIDYRNILIVVIICVIGLFIFKKKN